MGYAGGEEMKKNLRVRVEVNDGASTAFLLELEEVEMAADKGSKRVRVDHADKCSTQVRLPF